LRLGVERLPMPRSIGPGDLSASVAVARSVARMRPDVVHCHGAKGGVYGRLAAFAERRRGRPVAAFYAPHGGSLHHAKASVAGRIYFAAERALEPLTDGLIHVSAFEARTYREKVGAARCPSHVVRNGLRPEDFDPVTPSPGAVDFLFIGELRHLKGVDVFIEALALLAREGTERSAVIVGPGAPEDVRRYREAVGAAGLGSAVSFRPPIPAREAFALAHTVVVPSRAESLPYLVLEAAAAGMPLLVTDVGGIPEIFQGTGKRLLPAGDARALAEAMRTVVAAPAAATAEAAECRKRLSRAFSLAATNKRIEGLYRAALIDRERALGAGTAATANLPR
jgi:glycosyltransferase involved in cell wall biosynthesis